jgi:hypothetical protein
MQQLFGWRQEGLAKRADWRSPLTSPPSLVDLPTTVSSDLEAGGHIPQRVPYTEERPEGRHSKPSLADLQTTKEYLAFHFAKVVNKPVQSSLVTASAL